MERSLAAKAAVHSLSPFCHGRLGSAPQRQFQPSSLLCKRRKAPQHPRSCGVPTTEAGCADGSSSESDKVQDAWRRFQLRKSYDAEHSNNNGSTAGSSSSRLAVQDNVSAPLSSQAQPDQYVMSGSLNGTHAGTHSLHSTHNGHSHVQHAVDSMGYAATPSSAAVQLPAQHWTTSNGHSRNGAGSSDSSKDRLSSSSSGDVASSASSSNSSSSVSGRAEDDAHFSGAPSSFTSTSGSSSHAALSSTDGSSNGSSFDTSRRESSGSLGALSTSHSTISARSAPADAVTSRDAVAGTSNSDASTTSTATSITAVTDTASSSPSAAASASPPAIPRPILVLSLVSASLTMASSVFNTALPIYMVTELKMSMASMGMFDGALEAFSYIVRMLSGVVSDAMTSRKSAIALGFFMGAAAKFGIAGAVTVPMLFGSKAIDRLANGVQAAPRDALIGDLSPPGGRSACYGFAQSMRKWGSAVGALAAYCLMRCSNNNYQMIFYTAAAVSLASAAAFVLLVPAHTRPGAPAAPPLQAAAAVTLTAAPAAAAPVAKGVPMAAVGQGVGAAAAPAVSEQSTDAAVVPAGSHISRVLANVRTMGRPFWRMLMVVCMYGSCHIGESLLEARAIEAGIGKAESTLVVAALCLVTFISAYPLGRLDDRYGPRVTFAVGMGSLILGNLTLLLSGTYPLAVFAACLPLGVHWAVIQGPMLSIVAGLAPPHLRGTAFGIFYTLMAVTAMCANSMYGAIWTHFSALHAFGLSASLMACVLLALPWLLPPPQQSAAPQPAFA